ncbi:uncharacterized protein LOC135576554 [Columba livia]|uniref:uncharacterized protein LOC135576554 n=1 Tax=Columba livia TaxID=8932 RepID=UPI0031BB3CB9
MGGALFPDGVRGDGIKALPSRRASFPPHPCASQATPHTTMCSRQDKDQCHRQERYSGGCHSSGGGCHSSGGGCHSSGGGGGCHSSGGGCHSSGGGCHSSGGGCHSSGGGCHGSGGSYGKPQIPCQQQQKHIPQVPSQKMK